MKFDVTLPGPRNVSYEGSYEILDSGALKVTTVGGQLTEYFSPCGWLWVGEERREHAKGQAGHKGPPPAV